MIKASEIGNVDEVRRIREITKMFNGKIVGVYERISDGNQSKT
jgi:hypothetical protein